VAGGEFSAGDEIATIIAAITNHLPVRFFIQALVMACGNETEMFLSVSFYFAQTFCISSS
jgi:hypothetical protein